MRRLWLLASSLVSWLLVAAVSAQTGNPTQQYPTPNRQAIQAQLLKSVQAKKAKVGDTVKARTITAAILPNGTVIPIGATLLGHVRDVEADSRSSAIAISFEEAELKKGQRLPLNLSIVAAMEPGPPGSQQQATELYSIPDSPSPNLRPSRGRRSSAVSTANKAVDDLNRRRAQQETKAKSEPKLEPNVKAAHTGSVIGMQGTELLVDDAPQHASTFKSAKKNLHLDDGLQLMLVVLP